MKKLGLRLAAAAMSFILGVSVAWVWRSLQAGTWLSWGTRQTLPYCEVARNGERYHNRIIRVRARLILDSGAMYVFEDCDPVSALASLVQMDGAEASDKRGYVDKLLVEGASVTIKQVDAVIEGRFNAKFSRGCYAPKYKIAATKVELLGPLTDYVPPVANGEGMRAKH